MLRLNKSKPRYYITQQQLYLITETQLQPLGQLSELFSNAILAEPSLIFLGADCYEIFINSAEQIYSAEHFVKQNQKNFVLHFPYLEVEKYQLFFEKPQFNKPYLGIAVNKYWLESLKQYLNKRKFFNTDIQPLATYLFKNNVKEEQVFSCLEPLTETLFIHVDHMLDMIIRKPRSEITEVTLQTWKGIK
ncbi:hypothetical protein MKL42_02210 [Acinetobacter sp. AOR15_HL]|uniref:hypothetical protein n=1 Tax=unclassified Acinetobacter TaxID=196816 RepID=UPI0022EB792F|nr:MULTISPECIES: hypothetical protein [unclassified Acinetobacter]MDA3556333.1 hypothetical protein [Acinetobacter sp. AOR15_HL]MDA3571790.1 hypothetical protein [Acinetobacter sp. AOR14_HL]